MASYFYSTHGAFSGVEVFLRRVACANLSIQTSSAARGYLLTLYGDTSQVLYLEQYILDDDSSAIHPIDALRKAIILEIPGINEAVKPRLSNPRLDPATRDMIDPERRVR